MEKLYCNTCSKMWGFSFYSNTSSNQNFLCFRRIYDIFVGYEVLETVVTLVRHEHMLQVVWKTVETWQEKCVESAARVRALVPR